jgi:hypothetical protein
MIPEAWFVCPGSVTANLVDGRVRISSSTRCPEWVITRPLIATVTARVIEWRSVYEARLTEEEVAERLLAREPRGA